MGVGWGALWKAGYWGWGRVLGQAGGVRVRACGCVFLMRAPHGLTRSPPPQLLYFKGGPWPWRVGGAWFPRQFSLSHHSSFSPRACAHAHTEGSFSAHPRTSRLPPHHLSPPPPPPLAAQARHFRGGPGGGDGRRGRPTLDPSNSVTTSLLGGNVLALCSLSPARPLSPRTLASSQPECVCGGESAPPAKAQAP